MANRAVSYHSGTGLGTMMLNRLLLLGAVMATAACRTPAPSAASRPPEDDAREVEALLRRWYDASERHDSAAYAALMLPEFFIFEDTTMYDKPTLNRLVAEGFAYGTDRANLSDFKTAVSGDAAWTSFRNEEVWTPNGGKAEPPRRYLESAVFRRVDGRWLLERYHATRINRTAGP